MRGHDGRIKFHRDGQGTECALKADPNPPGGGPPGGGPPGGDVLGGGPPGPLRGRRAQDDKPDIKLLEKPGSHDESLSDIDKLRECSMKNSTSAVVTSAASLVMRTRVVVKEAEFYCRWLSWERAPEPLKHHLELQAVIYGENYMQIEQDFLGGVIEIEVLAVEAIGPSVEE